MARQQHPVKPIKPLPGADDYEHDRVTLFDRARELIDFLLEHDGITGLSKRELADVMVTRYGRRWQNRQGEPDRRLLGEVCNVTRDQAEDPVAKEIFAGFVIAYSPSAGGMCLLDPAGGFGLPHMLMHLAGDVQRQQVVKTTNRRRMAMWKAASLSALGDHDFELGRLLAQAENEIDAHGFVSDTVATNYLKAIQLRRVAEPSG